MGSGPLPPPRHSCLPKLPRRPAAPPLQRACGPTRRRKSPATRVRKPRGPGAPPGPCTTTFITTRPGAPTCTETLHHSRPSPKWIPVTSRRIRTGGGTAFARGTASHQGLDPVSPRAPLHLRRPALGSQCPTRGPFFTAAPRGSASPARVDPGGGV